MPQHLVIEDACRICSLFSLSLFFFYFFYLSFPLSRFFAFVFSLLFPILLRFFFRDRDLFLFLFPFFFSYIRNNRWLVSFIERMLFCFWYITQYFIRIVIFELRRTIFFNILVIEKVSHARTRELFHFGESLIHINGDLEAIEQRLVKKRGLRGSQTKFRNSSYYQPRESDSSRMRSKRRWEFLKV